MNTPEKVLLTVLLLASLIFVHELGHFLMAKLFKVRVLKFSLGFGPRLVGFQWGETEYRISAIPLGGYVKMAGDEPSEELRPEDRGRGFLEQAPWKRAAIGLAGPMTNLVFPIFVFFAAFYFQTMEVSSRLGQVLPDQPAYAAGLRAGDRIVAVDGKPVHYFTELQQLIGPQWEKPVSVTFERGGQEQTVQVVPQRREEKSLIESEVRGVIGVSSPGIAPIVGIADLASPAAQAGLQTFDRVVKVDGRPVATYPDLELALAGARGPLKLTVVRDTPLSEQAGALTVYKTFEATLEPRLESGRPYFGIEPTELFVFSVEKGSPAWDMGIRRGDKLLAVNGAELHGWMSFDRARTETKDKPLSVAFLHAGERMERAALQREVTRTDEFDNRFPVLLFGAHPDLRLTSLVEPERIPLKLSATAALARSMRVVPDEVRKTGLVLARLVQGKLSFKSVGGPIMMYDIASRAAEAGFEYFLQIVALISINLGMINLLPIPVLDGFHILSALFEEVRGRPMSIQARTVANYIGLAMLFTLMVFVFKNDIVRFILN